MDVITLVLLPDLDGYLIEVAQATGMLSGHLAAKRPEDLPVGFVVSAVEGEVMAIRTSAGYSERR